MIAPNKRRSTRIVLLALAAVATLVASGCGKEEKRSGAEGEFIEVGDAVYQVQLTRLLNPGLRPDKTLLRGQVTPPPDEQYLAVFLKIDNEGGDGYRPPRDMRLVDSAGSQYSRLDAGLSGFGLDFGEQIPPGEEAPPPDSPAASGPTAGAMVLFRIKTESATENLPLRLEVPVAGEAKSVIELDI